MAKCADPHACSRVMRVLADETRLRLVRALLRGRVRVSDLAARLGVSTARVSHHLAILRAAGVVEDAREGRSVYYAISPVLRDAGTADALDLGCCHIVFRPLGRAVRQGGRGEHGP